MAYVSCSICTNKAFFTVLFGQAISLLVAGTGVFSTWIANAGVDAPTSQSILSYSLLSLFLVVRLACPRLNSNTRMPSSSTGEHLNDSTEGQDTRQHSDGTNGCVKSSRSDSEPLLCSPVAKSLGTPVESRVPAAAPRLQDSGAPHALQTPDNQPALLCGCENLDCWKCRPCCSELSVPWWRYAVLGFTDVEANFLVVMAYYYTTLTSVMLLDCLSIPTAMLLESIFLRRRFTWIHIGAGLVCLVGLIVLVIGDAVDPGDSSSSGGSQSGGGRNATLAGNGADLPPSGVSPARSLTEQVLRLAASASTPPSEWSQGGQRALGDMLCVLGSILYACNNVAQEALVRGRGGPGEYLGGVGAFGAVVSVVQVLVLERRGALQLIGLDPVSGSHPGGVQLHLAGFVVCLVAMYVLTAHFLQHADAAFFNISLLSSDAWAALAAAAIFGNSLSAWYWVSLVIVVSGALVFHLVGGEPTTLPHEPSYPDSRATASPRGSSPTSGGDMSLERQGSAESTVDKENLRSTGMAKGYEAIHPD